ncbi:GWxTD domain-containing protein [candidate division KSB1 bacterium]|nr:GWxTD domain-containing protein [candidate division KSB1 bacterium]
MRVLYFFATLIFAFAIISFSAVANAQEASSPKPFMVEADYAIFRSNGGKRPYLEIAYGIRRDALVYTASSADSAIADLMMRVNIAKGDSLWVADMWRTPDKIAVADTARGQRIVNVLRYPIHSGTHRVKLFARDLRGAAKSDSVVMAIAHEAIVPEALAMSDIELASSIKPVRSENGSPNDVFCKQSMRVIPNPSAIFGAEQPMLYYYLEIYNLRQNVSGSSYRTKCYLAGAGGAPLSSPRPREQTKPMMEASVEVGALNVSAVPSGTYFLHFDLLDAEGKSLQSARKKVFVYNPQLQAAPAAAVQSIPVQVFAGLSDEEVANEVGYVKYFYDKAETEIAKKLAHAPARREFLAQFWSRYSREKNMPWQELRTVYLQAVALANDNFSSMTIKGWRTDRGRVYLIYGKPDDIERFPYSNENKPYEIWTYNGIEGGVDFIFADQTGLREYRLLHSTKLGEIKNEDWRDLIAGQ